MSLEFENQEGEVTTRPLFSSTEIKGVRFMLGAITVKLSTKEHPNGPNTLDVLLRQNLDSTTSMAMTPLPTEVVALVINDSNGTNENEGEPKTIEENKGESEEEYLKSMQGWLLTVATLLLNLTFNAALNPPAELDHAILSLLTNNGTTFTHNAISLLKDTFVKEKFKTRANLVRYAGFKCLSSMAFHLSIVIVVQLLLKRSFSSVHRLLSIRFLLLYDICIIMIMYSFLMSYSPTDIIISYAGLVLLFLSILIIFSLRFLLQAHFKGGFEPLKRCLPPVSKP